MKVNQSKLNKIVNLVLSIIMLLGVVVLPASTLVPMNSQMQSYIVQGVSAQQASVLVLKYGGMVTSNLEIIDGVGALLPEGSVALLRSEPGITAVTDNAQMEVAGKDSEIPATDYPDVTGADVVWEQGVLGKGIGVAVVDTGIDLHAGLIVKSDKKERGIAWVDFVDNKKTPVDPNGHGTHIAGIIGNSQKGSDKEWNGMAPAVNLVGVRVLDKNGSGSYEKVIQGVQWVVKNKKKYNIRVMNLSMSAEVQSPYWADPLNQAVMKAWASGIVVVTSAGNKGPGPMSIGVPGNNPYVITVGAFTDHRTTDIWGDDYVVNFSSAGPTLDGFVKPDVVAPGAHIVSTIAMNSILAKNHDLSTWVGSRYFEMSGTSQSAGIVSGLVALVLSNNPKLTPDEVKYRIMVSANPWITSNAEKVSALYSVWQQGSGRINSPDAVFADIQGVANKGMDIKADIAGTTHYEGYSYYDNESGKFRLEGDYGVLDSSYWTWDGSYGEFTDAFGFWGDGKGLWSDAKGLWSDAKGLWSDGKGLWSDARGLWSDGKGLWSDAKGIWSDGYGSWADGYVAWTGNEPWSMTTFANPDYVKKYLAGESPNSQKSSTTLGKWIEEP